MGSGNSLFRDSTGKFRLSDSKAAKFSRLSPNCDFREYMAQKRGDTEEMWRSASSPALKEIKKGPSLPQLVKNSSAVTPTRGKPGHRSDAKTGSSLHRCDGARSATSFRST